MDRKHVTPPCEYELILCGHCCAGYRCTEDCSYKAEQDLIEERRYSFREEFEEYIHGFYSDDAAD